jgi:hypothetical protein
LFESALVSRHVVEGHEYLADRLVGVAEAGAGKGEVSERALRLDLDQEVRLTTETSIFGSGFAWAATLVVTRAIAGAIASRNFFMFVFSIGMLISAGMPSQ